MSEDQESSPPAALSGRPDARVFSVEKLIAEVLAGAVRIPKFQRPLRWDLKDVLSLLDSIYRGYPIGTLLLWKRPAAADRIVHGSVIVEASAMTDALWVVDGQQRIVSLTRVLTGTGFPDEPFAAFFDLKRREFVRPPRGREPPASHLLPLTEVLDSKRLLRWLRRSQLDEELESVAIELGKLREYQITAYVVATDDERAVREIFRRANDTGKRMVDSDVFDALYSAGGSPASLREVSGLLRGVGFGSIDEPTLLKMLLATRGTELTKDRVPDLAPAEARQGMLDLTESARATLLFLREEAGIPHVSLLPYQQPLFALARFFHRHPRPHPRSRELLSRWLWRGALMGVHGGTTVQTRQMLAAIEDDEHASVQALLATLPGRSEPELGLDDYSFGYARCKIQLLALLELAPRDVRTGAPVFAEPGDGDEDPYKSMVREICPDLAGERGGLANRMFHPGVRTGLARAITDCHDDAVLESHAISDAARLALKFDRSQEFLALRRAALQRHIAAFGARRARWDEADTPPVESLRVEVG